MSKLVFWLTVIIGLIFIFESCVSQNQNGKNNDVLDKQISAIRKLLSDNKGKEGYKLINADLWRKLGIILQSKDIRHHQGGGRLQPEALEAFNNALRLDEGRTQSLNIQVNYLKGILLKMMGSGDESLQSLDLALEHKLTTSDWSSVSYHKGEAFLMLGQIPAAAQWYRKSIKLAPCKTDRYYSFVQACRELKTMTREKWIALMNEIRHVMQACLSDEELNVSFEEFDSLDRSIVDGEDSSQEITNGTSSGDDDEEELEEEDYSLQSYLQFNDDGDDSNTFNVENSAVYWALYITAEKAERFSLAWWYLDKANALEKSRREIKYQREDTLGQRNQITGVFQKGFWDSLPDMSGDSSRTPIFIIGMMRSV
jgi:tetratricopeptide (TPR) repeat protein